MLTRRNFLAGSTAALGLSLLPSCARQRSASSFPGKILGANAVAAHRLRAGPLPPPTEEIETEFVVLGGGIAGLSAARRLWQRGARDLFLLELESETGGNALSGRNAVSAYPWGAHYLPLPSEESTEVTELLEELGLITGRAANADPIFDEYALCSDPMERLFVNGAWQEGLIPRLDVSSKERQEIDGFLDRMDRFRSSRGSDGRRAFAIPVDRSSQDASFRQLDQITMAAYLDREGWRGEALRWYVDYCCRDDYGAGIEQISAWAGIHYFASRNGRATNASSSAVLTWPEGNGWLARRLREPITDRIRTRALVGAIAVRDDAVDVDYLDLERDRVVRVRARGAVCAMPRFVSQRLIQTSRGPIAPTSGLTYSPWMVANLTLEALPGTAHSTPAWDNVFRQSRSLGYVVATHQDLRAHPAQTVLTYYQPLDGDAPAAEREKALARSHAEWCEQIVADLERAHPEIRSLIRNIDVWLWGHAMIRPTPGFIWGATRAAMQEPIGRVVFAHSDMSGLSIFEEAHTRGRAAADAVMRLVRPSQHS